MPEYAEGGGMTGIYCPWPRKRGGPRQVVNVRRDYWQKLYGLTEKQARWITPLCMEQLERCKTDEIRRILLGISH